MPTKSDPLEEEESAPRRLLTANCLLFVGFAFCRFFVGRIPSTRKSRPPCRLNRIPSLRKSRAQVVAAAAGRPLRRLSGASPQAAFVSWIGLPASSKWFGEGFFPSSMRKSRRKSRLDQGDLCAAIRSEPSSPGFAFPLFSKWFGEGYYEEESAQVRPRLG